MDYEDKYKNALKWARGVYPNAVGADKEDLEHYFPELAESEDERIRNDLKRAISVALDYSYLDKKCANNCLAWLETNRIHYWAEEEIEPIISDYLRGTEHYGGMIARLRCLKPKSLEKQGEQKPSDNSIDAFIDKACEWLKDNYPYYFETDIEQGFKKAMKGE